MKINIVSPGRFHVMDLARELDKQGFDVRFYSFVPDKRAVKFELIGYLISANTSVIKEKNIRFSTESDYNINRFSKLLSNLEINHDIDVNGKTFNIITKALDMTKLTFLEIKENEIYLKDEIKHIGNDVKAEERKRAFIRGAFLGAGSINNPENAYHLEFVISNENNLKILKEMLKEMDVQTKALITKSRYSIYIKEGEEISKLLALIGANKAVMQFEDIRIKKEMRGKVNRIVNCETANLNKTINAAIEQIGAIKKLQKDGRFNKLDDNLKEIAILRIENPDMSLIELGKLLKEPVGKSGVNYRLKKIVEIANGK